MPAVACPNCKRRMLSPTPECPGCGYELPASLFSRPATSGLPTTKTTISSIPSPTPFTSAMKKSKAAASTPAHYASASSPSTSVSSSPNEVSGVVIDPPTTMEIPRAIDWSHIVLSLCFIPFSLLFLLVFFSTRDHPDYRTLVTRIRVQRPDGSMREARVEGDLMGAGLSQGDNVQLYGKSRGGALIVMRGYNHSIAGEILIHQRHSSVGARIIACAIIALYSCVILCYVTTLISLMLSNHH